MRLAPRSTRWRTFDTIAPRRRAVSGYCGGGRFHPDIVWVTRVSRATAFPWVLRLARAVPVRAEIPDQFVRQSMFRRQVSGDEWLDAITDERHESRMNWERVASSC